MNSEFIFSCKISKLVFDVPGSGLGRLMSHRFAKLGCTLVLWDVNKEGNEGTANAVREYGSPVHTYVCDLSSREEINKSAQRVS